MTTFKLEELESILLAFNPEDAAVYTNNCITALEKNEHRSGCSLFVEGDHPTQFCLEWSKKFKPARYREHTEVMKNAAEAISFFLIEAFTAYRVVDQAEIGQGFDYWLACDENDENDESYDARNFLKGKARLEVSGIGEETPSNTVGRRFDEKLEQTDKSDHLGYEAFISVVEFGRPWAKFKRK